MSAPQVAAARATAARATAARTTTRCFSAWGRGPALLLGLCVVACGPTAEPHDPAIDPAADPAAPTAPTAVPRAAHSGELLEGDAPHAPNTPASLPTTVRFGPDANAPRVDLSARAGRTEIEVFEPYELQAVRFAALPALPLLDDLLGPAWRDADELVFECADGYRAAVPVSRFLAHQGYLAVARIGGGDGGADFAIDKPVGGAVVHTWLGPAYLIWENVRDELVRAEGDWGWPYQVVGVTVAQSATERYARMAPPADASPSAAQGFAVFRRYCTRCHAINGEGGQVGPELNYPASVSEYIEPTWLRRWIDAPQSVRRGTPMPGLPQGIPARDQALTDVIAYLNAMAARKLGPPAAPPP